MYNERSSTAFNAQDSATRFQSLLRLKLPDSEVRNPDDLWRTNNLRLLDQVLGHRPLDYAQLCSDVRQHYETAQSQDTLDLAESLVLWMRTRRDHKALRAGNTLLHWLINDTPRSQAKIHNALMKQGRVVNLAVAVSKKLVATILHQLAEDTTHPVYRAQALESLATCYRAGFGVQRDRGQAIAYSKQAINAGSLTAIRQCGVLLSAESDDYQPTAAALDEACHHFETALRRGDETCIPPMQLAQTNKKWLEIVSDTANWQQESQILRAIENLTNTPDTPAWDFLHAKESISTVVEQHLLPGTAQHTAGPGHTTAPLQRELQTVSRDFPLAKLKATAANLLCVPMTHDQRQHLLNLCTTAQGAATLARLAHAWQLKHQTAVPAHPPRKAQRHNTRNPPTTPTRAHP